MNVVLLGPPGAGKGTQADMLAARFGVPHVATGDMFRQAVAEGTEVGIKAKEYMLRGALIPDEIVIEAVRHRLGKPDCAPGVILDGFPRTIQQAEALDAVLTDLGKKLDAVINLEVSDETIIERLSGRRVCQKCGANFHVKHNPPAVAGKCNCCGGELYQREDDKESTVKHRLEVYASQTEPLLAYYDGKGLLIRVNGEQPVNLVKSKLEQVLEGLVGDNPKV